jgi:outer membrane protein insertion porin family
LTDLIAAALGHVLQARHLPGRIDYMPYSKLDGSGRQHIFSVKDPGVKTCGLHVDGTSGVPERDVMKVAQSLIGIDYSRHYVADFSRKSMTQPYRQRGYWRAAFQGPITTIGGVPGCDGVQVTLRVDEGLSYAWDHAEWTGNAAFTARELDGLLAFKPGDVADGAKIEAGLRLINAAHGKRGYLAEQATSEPVLDDSAKRAVFRIAIAEGPQFHMGTFTVAGLSAKDAESLAKRWKLKPGEVYDQTYLQEFQITELRAYSTPAHPATAQVRPDSRTHIVDVTIVFK